MIHIRVWRDGTPLEIHNGSDKDFPSYDGECNRDLLRVPVDKLDSLIEELVKARDYINGKSTNYHVFSIK